MLACVINFPSSSSADKYLKLSTSILPFFTSLYGVSIKPKLLTFAKTLREEINPIFGPSGVSIGHNLP